MQNSKLYVGNLNYAVTEEQLQELFGSYGTVESVKIIGDRGFGFVEMSTPEEAEQAMEALNETVFQERALRVNEARPPKRRRRVKRKRVADGPPADRIEPPDKPPPRDVEPQKPDAGTPKTKRDGTMNPFGRTGPDGGDAD